MRVFFSKKQPRGVHFVVGVYNSGTTIVKELIAAHPDVTTPPIEGDRLSGALSSFEEDGWPRAMFGNAFKIRGERQCKELSASELIADLVPWIGNSSWLVEKSISNTLRIPQLRHAFPGTRFVCVVREPEAVVRGIQKRSQPTGKARELFNSDSYPGSFLLRQWAYFYRTVVEDAEADSSDICFCHYEKIMAEPAEELGRIFVFLGLPEVTLENDPGGLLVNGKKILLAPSSKKGSADYSDRPLAHMVDAVERQL